MALSGTGADLAAQVIDKAVSLLEGCAASCYAYASREVSQIKKDAAKSIEEMKEEIQRAKEQGGEKSFCTEEDIRREERRSEKNIVRAEGQKGGIDLMLEETRRMLGGLVPPSGTGTEPAAQVVAEAIELLEGCARKSKATATDGVAVSKDPAEMTVEEWREKIRQAMEDDFAKSKEPVTREQVEAEKTIARAEGARDGIDLMLMETRLMLRSLEFHVKKMGEAQGRS